MPKVFYNGSIASFRGWILAEAADNVMVASVRVTVLDPQGKVLEAGEAVRGEGEWWEFAAQTHGDKIVAEAWDLPGHKAKFLL